MTPKARNSIIYMFTHLKLCAAATTHNLKTNEEKYVYLLKSQTNVSFQVTYLFGLKHV